MSQLTKRVENNQTKQEQNKKLQICLDDILDEYKILSMKLHKDADYVPADLEDSLRISNQQDKLLDQQQDLLASARLVAIKGNEELATLMDLWYLDEVSQRNKDELSAGTLLALRVYDHLDDRRI